jgi:cytochrome c oxidase assembly protein subunit 15
MATAALSPARAIPARLRIFSWAVVFYNVLVVLWGALVRATGSGAGCGNHWPLCNGQVIPVSPSAHTIIEFTHRMMTGGSTFLVLGLLVWTLRASVRGQAARGFAIASTLLLFNEALLGALLVKLDYVVNNQSVGRMVLLSIHLSNTLLLVAALVLTARMLSTGQRWSELRNSRGLGLVAAGLFATILVGVSGSLAALGDTLFPAGSLGQAFAQDLSADSPALLKLRIVHPISALAAGAFVLYFVARSRRHPPARFGVKWMGSAVLWLLGFQVAMGVADVLLLAPAWMQILHLLGADLFWVALVMLSAQTIWPHSNQASQAS